MNKKALRVPDYLDHMQEAIARILRFTQGKSFRTFCADEQLQDAVIRNIEIIGEAANNIQKHAPDYVHAHPGIPWSALYAMRNRVAHGYWTLDLELV